MAKYFGNVGFAVYEKGARGVTLQKIVERPYYGDILRITSRPDSSDKVNDDVKISNEISIVADGFATDNIAAMKYVTLGGGQWKINSVEIRPPRLILQVGGLYNAGEQETRTSS